MPALAWHGVPRATVAPARRRPPAPAVAMAARDDRSKCDRCTVFQACPPTATASLARVEQALLLTTGWEPEDRCTFFRARGLDYARAEQYLMVVRRLDRMWPVASRE